MFQNRLAALEGGEMCAATAASGMMRHYVGGYKRVAGRRHLVSSRSIFGLCIAVFRRKRAAARDYWRFDQACGWS